MYSNEEQQQENVLESANLTQRKSNKSSAPPPFIDNRPETQAYGALQKMADNSKQHEEPAQLQKMANDHADQQQSSMPKPNNTGLPDNLKSGIENLSGYSMDDVKVHYNSDKPAQLQAYAYAQGTDIHIGSGQEKHLPHEAWHVVQQKQGRVKPTVQMKGGVDVNDDTGLEREADVMGRLSMQNKEYKGTQNLKKGSKNSTLQRVQMINKNGTEKWGENYSFDPSDEEMNTDIEKNDFKVWMDSLPYYLKKNETETNPEWILYFRYSEESDYTRKYDTFNDLSSGKDKYNALKLFYNAYKDFHNGGVENNGEVENQLERQIPPLLERFKGNMKIEINGGDETPLYQEDLNQFNTRITKISELYSNIKSGNDGYNYNYRSSTNAICYNTFMSKSNTALGDSNMSLIRKNILNIITTANSDYMYKSKSDFEYIHDKLVADGGIVGEIDFLLRKYEEFYNHWGHNSNRENSNKDDQKKNLNKLLGKIRNNQKNLKIIINLLKKQIDQIYNEEQGIDDEFIQNARVRAIDKKLAIEHKGYASIEEAACVSKFKKTFQSEDELKSYFINRWRNEKTIDYNEDIDTSGLNNIVYHNGITQEEVCSEPDGSLKLKMLSDISLKSNTRVRRTALLINRIGHTHLCAGAKGLAFAYEKKEDIIVPHVIDIADSRQNNEYKWRNGGQGYNPARPDELPDVIKG